MTCEMARHLPLRTLDFHLPKSTEHWDFERARRLGDNIPGYRYSATFLSTLRTNIQLSTTDSMPSSPMVPPTLQSLLPEPSPSPLSIVTSYQNPVAAPMADQLPRLGTYTASSIDDKTAALKLVADSVAQQRQIAAKGILINPYVLASLICVLSLEWYRLSTIPLLTTATGTVMIVLVAIRWLTSGYIFAAEHINWQWLTDATPVMSASTSNHSHSSSNGHRRGRSATIEEPMVMVTKWGDDIIGALIIRVSKREKRAFIRAWTVARRYRGKGVGRDLLHEGVRTVMGKAGVKGVEFEDEDVFSSRLLPPFFHTLFDAREQQAHDVLADVVAKTKVHRRSNS